MSLLNDVRKSITDAADTIVEKGQQLSELARLQIAMKKLQVDRAKRLHELGTRAYALYQVEKLLAKNPLPREIHEMCEPIEEIDRQMEDTQRQMEVVHAAAQEEGGAHTTGATHTVSVTHTVEAVATNGHAPESGCVPLAETFVTQTTIPVAPIPAISPSDAAELLKRIETLERQLSREREESPAAPVMIVEGSSSAVEVEPPVAEGIEVDAGGVEADPSAKEH